MRARAPFAVALLAAVASLVPSCAREPKRALPPLTVRSLDVALPVGARVEPATSVADLVRITWPTASAPGTRCGERAEASLTFGPSLLPDGYSQCGRHNPFAGGSSDGDCPVTNVCVAARRGVQMICLSDDDACLAVAPTFAK